MQKHASCISEGAVSPEARRNGVVRTAISIRRWLLHSCGKHSFRWCLLYGFSVAAPVRLSSRWHDLLPSGLAMLIGPLPGSTPCSASGSLPGSTFLPGTFQGRCGPIANVGGRQGKPKLFQERVVDVQAGQQPARCAKTATILFFSETYTHVPLAFVGTAGGKIARFGCARTVLETLINCPKFAFIGTSILLRN